MAEAPSVAQVAQAVLVACAGTDPSQQREANQWLMGYAQSQAAWETALNMIACGQPTEVEFYMSNMLLSKVKNEWLRLPPEAKNQLTQAVFGKVQALASTPGAASVVITRLCLVMAASAALSGVDAAVTFMQQALSLGASGNATIAIGLLSAIAEEIESSERTSRQQMVGAVSAHLADILGLIEAGAAAGGRSLGDSLQCLQAWMKLDPRGAGGSLLSLNQLHTMRPGCLQVLLAALACQEDAAFEAAVETLIVMLQAGAAGEEAVAGTIMNTVLSHQATALDPNNTEEHARGLTRVGVALIEHSGASIAAGQGSSLALTQFMMNSAKHPERVVSEASMDYFLCLNTFPLQERHPEHQMPLFQQLLEVVMVKAAYPSDFTSWAECCDDDADSFNRYREQVLTDILDTVYSQLRLGYLQIVWSSLQAATTWQAAEAAIFAFRAVNLAVKSWIYNARASEQNPGIAADREQSSACLEGLFTRVTTEGEGGLLSSHPMVMNEVAKLLGNYAQWFGSAPSAPVHGALSTLLRGLRIPDVWTVASNAFRNICSRCERKLQDGGSLAGLIEASEQCLPPVGSVDAAVPGQEERSAVVQGLARIISGLTAADCSSAGLRLITPLTARIQHLTPVPAGTTPSPLQVPCCPPVALFCSNLSKGADNAGEQRDALALEMMLFGEAIRFFDKFSDGAGVQQPAMAMLEAAWPALDTVVKTPTWQEQGGVMEALCNVYMRSLSSTK
eukprot:gene488-877_t